MSNTLVASVIGDQVKKKRTVKKMEVTENDGELTLTMTQSDGTEFAHGLEDIENVFIEPDNMAKSQDSDEVSGVLEDCPDCGSNNILYDDEEEPVCSECGLVIGDPTSNTKTPQSTTERLVVSIRGEQFVGDRTAEMIELTEPLDDQLLELRKSDGTTYLYRIEAAENISIELRNKTDLGSGDKSVPETVDEWKMWYPCPECQSTALEQIVEQHLSVTATKDGSYGGDTGGVDEYNYIECSDCGTVLLDEISKLN